MAVIIPPVHTGCHKATSWRDYNASDKICRPLSKSSAGDIWGCNCLLDKFTLFILQMYTLFRTKVPTFCPFFFLWVNLGSAPQFQPSSPFLKHTCTDRFFLVLNLYSAVSLFYVLCLDFDCFCFFVWLCFYLILHFI